MSQKNIENIIQKTLIDIFCWKKSITSDDGEKITTETAGDNDQGTESSDFDIRTSAKRDIFRLALKPNLSEELLKLFADVMHRDATATQKLLSGLKNLSSSHVKALVTLFTRAANSGYQVAQDVLMEMCHEAPSSKVGNILSTIKQTCAKDGRFAALRAWQTKENALANNAENRPEKPANLTPTDTSSPRNRFRM